MVAALLLAGGIVSIVTRDAISNAGNVSLIILYGLAAGAGYLLAGSYADLIVWATWCLLCALVAAMAIAADNICSAWVYILLIVIGLILAAGGIGFNIIGEKSPATGSGDQKASQEEGSTQDSDENDSGENYSAVTPFGDLGDYHVEIKNAVLASDYEGNPAIIITYSWKNNSEDTTSAMSVFMEKAFQNGVQLDTAIVTNSDIYDSESTWKDIRPGASLDVQRAYELTSETGSVEFEISEFLSFSDGTVSMMFDLAELS